MPNNFAGSREPPSKEAWRRPPHERSDHTNYISEPQTVRAKATCCSMTRWPSAITAIMRLSVIKTRCVSDMNRCLRPEQYRFASPQSDDRSDSGGCRRDGARTGIGSAERHLPADLCFLPICDGNASVGYSPKSEARWRLIRTMGSHKQCWRDFTFPRDNCTTRATASNRLTNWRPGTPESWAFTAGSSTE